MTSIGNSKVKNKDPWKFYIDRRTLAQESLLNEGADYTPINGTNGILGIFQLSEAATVVFGKKGCPYEFCEIHRKAPVPDSFL